MTGGSRVSSECSVTTMTNSAGCLCANPHTVWICTQATMKAMLEWLSRKQMKLHNAAIPVLVFGVWFHAAAAASCWAFACAYTGYDWWHACELIKSAQHTHAEARLRSRMSQHILTFVNFSAKQRCQTYCCCLGPGSQSTGLVSANKYERAAVMFAGCILTKTAVTTHLRFSSSSEARNIKHPRQVLSGGRVSHALH